MPEPAQDESRRYRWEDAVDLPLTVAALVFLVAYAWPILDTSLTHAELRVGRVATLVSWAAFVVDYVVRLVLSRQRTRFVRRHLLDLAVVLVPFLRPLRLLALVRVLTVLDRKAGSSLRGRVAVYVVGATVLVVFVASLAVLDAERRVRGSNIATFHDAVWWAFETVTTVGYGDYYPVSALGRGVAVGLMIAGIALLGVVTASLATWLIDRISEDEEHLEEVSLRAQAATREAVETLTAEVRELREELTRRGTDGARRTGGE